MDSCDKPPSGPQRRFAIGALRFYRRHWSPRLGARCVFDPSCSRYAELAIRAHGVRRGVLMTVHRLRRCRPGNGGTDFPEIGGG
ncbi:MAG: membrane protein insertion efficiency factor YidD [Dehalococcoidia bacterium]|nr:membrane protein insertion efficiency factor YidD [Dehalococcoidia bacterium]